MTGAHVLLTCVTVRSRAKDRPCLTGEPGKATRAKKAPDLGRVPVRTRVVIGRPASARYRTAPATGTSKVGASLGASRGMSAERPGAGTVPESTALATAILMIRSRSDPPSFDELIRRLQHLRRLGMVRQEPLAVRQAHRHGNGGSQCWHAAWPTRSSV
jgi:hypothetical protein